MPRPTAGSEPLHLLVDSTGLKLWAPGEWLAEKHGTKRRRSWRKLHLASDADTGRIVASVLTDREVDDGSQVGPLLDQIDGARGLVHRRRRLRSRRCLRRGAAPSEAAVIVHRARMRCPAKPQGPRRRSATGISDALPSAVAWAGRRPQGTTGAPWWRPMCRAGSASSVKGCARKRTGDRRPRWRSPSMC